MNSMLIENHRVRQIQPSRHFSISTGWGIELGWRHAWEAQPAATQKTGFPESTPLACYEGENSHIGTDRKKVGRFFARKLLPTILGVGGA